MKKYFLLLISCFILSATLFAQSLELTGQNIAEEASFAQPFEVRFELSYPPDTQVILDKNSLPTDFALAKENAEIPTPGTITYDLTFLPFTLGPSTFTAVNFFLQNKQGETIGQTVSQAVAVEVQPVQFFKDKEMRDIRPPYIPGSWLLLILGIVLLALLIAMIIYLAHRRKQHIQKTSQEQDNRPADVIALSKLNLLLQSGLWEKAQYKLFYIELGEILREYFWRRFRLDVSADTSTELLRRTRSVPELAPLYAQLRDYLKSSDLVKFAKYIPDADTMQKDVNIVQKTIQQTAPVPLAATETKEAK